MSGQVLAGQFDRVDPAYQPGFMVLVDGDGTPTTGYTPGATRVDQLPFSPTLVEKWSVIGYSVRVRLGLSRTITDGQMWGRLGSLWAGLISDSSLKPAQYANFPIDLSTFVKVFDGAQDEIRWVTNPGSFTAPGNIPDNTYTLIADTFMLPQPVEVRSGAQVQMCLVQTPSLLTVSAGTMQFNVRDCTYSVIYND